MKENFEGMVNSAANENDPSFEKERRGMENVLAVFSEKLKECEMKHRFHKNGKEYNLTCESDYMFAAMQYRKEVAQLVLEELQGMDYHEEKAAQKLVAMFEAQEQVASYHAELLQSYPANVEMLTALLPELDRSIFEAKQAWEEISEAA